MTEYPDLEQLLAEIDEARDLAANLKKVTLHNGEVKEYDQPDARTMVESTRLKCQLLGYLGQKQLTPEMAAKEVGKLVKRAKKRVANSKARNGDD